MGSKSGYSSSLVGRLSYDLYFISQRFFYVIIAKLMFIFMMLSRCDVPIFALSNPMAVVVVLPTMRPVPSFTGSIRYKLRNKDVQVIAQYNQGKIT